MRRKRGKIIGSREERVGGEGTNGGIKMEKARDYPEKIAPKIYLPVEVAKQIKALVALGEGEIGWCGLVKKIEGGDEGKKWLKGVLIEEIYVPKQTVSMVSVDVGPEAMSEYMDKLVEEGRTGDIERIRYQGHSHVNMGVTPSAQDEECWKEWSVSLLGNENKITAYTIHNKRKETYGRICVDVLGMGIVRMESPVVVLELANDPVRTWARKMIEQQTKEKKHEVLGMERLLPVVYRDKDLGYGSAYQRMIEEEKEREKNGKQRENYWLYY